MMTRLMTVLFPLTLAACSGSGGDAGVPANTAEAEANSVRNVVESSNAQTAVLAMNDRQRNVVFIRALLDAGIDCQSVTSSTRLPDQDGSPLWRAECGSGGAHMISITPDGTANIVSRNDR
jgi:hypothetical protein